MKKTSALLSIITMVFLGCSEEIKQEPNIDYPLTKTVDSSDVYFGTSINDPYRWLEDDTSAETKEWVIQQNTFTDQFISKIPYREAIEERYRKLFNYPKLSSPYKAGEYYFFYKNDGLQNQSVIYYKKGKEGEPEVFIDPNLLSEDGTTTIHPIGYSNDYKYVAMAKKEAGSDWQKIVVYDIASKSPLADELDWIKFSGAAWKNDGFYYSRYPEPKRGGQLSNSNEFHWLYYHKLGTSQSEDQLVYSDAANPLHYHYADVTEDKKFLILYSQDGTEGNSIQYMDLENKANGFKMLLEGYENKNDVLDHSNGRFLVKTDIDAPKYRLVSIDLNAPEKESWVNVIPESEYLLEEVGTAGKFIFANYLKKATTSVYRCNYDGSNMKEVSLPAPGSAYGFSAHKEDDELFYSFTSFTYPTTIFNLNLESLESTEFYKAELEFNPNDYESKQVMYKSKDGTEISMFIVHKKGLKLDGNNPTYLYGYGGFNISLTPSFSASRIILLENGGVFAMPNLRGGGEYGQEWHKAGMLDKKQNVFDDFIAAAEYLIAEKYTSPEKLAVSGRSNGGLLVGAVMTQRPELFKVAFPAVGVMDMLRYHKFTVGHGWTPEYGSSDEEKYFNILQAYSPLHNIKSGVKYPVTLVNTADHDDRVVPAHSFKFISTLQAAQTGSNPVLIRIETDAGHGAGKPTSKIIEEQAEHWSFFFYYLGVEKLYGIPNSVNTSK